MRRRLNTEEENRLVARLEVSLDNTNHFEAGLLASMALLINEVAALRQEISSVAMAADRLARFK